MGNAVLMCTNNLYFEQKYEKYQRVFNLKTFQFLEVKFSIYLNMPVFVMKCTAENLSSSYFVSTCFSDFR